MSSLATTSDAVGKRRFSTSTDQDLPPLALLPRPPTRKWVTFDNFDSLTNDETDSSFSSSSSVSCPMPPSSSSVMTMTTAPSSVHGAATVLSSSVSSDSSIASCVETSSSSSPPHHQLQHQHHHRRVDFSRSLGSDGESTSGEDRYSAFGEVRGQDKSGWSGKILHGSHVLGWSDEVLECNKGSGDGEVSPCSSVGSSRRGSQKQGSNTCAEQQQQKVAAPATPGVPDDDSWYSTFRNPSWDQSPDRSFVRNFP